jgi:phosphosulfolactate synthase
VNLGNVPAEEVIPLETLRLGLRGDTFFDHLPRDMAESLRQVKTEKPQGAKTKPVEAEED